MKECEAISVELPGYASGRLDPKSAGPVKAHLQECPACREQLVRLERLEKLLKGALPRIRPSPGFASTFAQRLAAEIAAEEDERAGGWASWLLQPWLVGLAATAVVAIVMIGVLNFSPWSSETPMPRTPDLSGALVRNPAGEAPMLASKPAEKNERIASAVPSDVLQRPELFVDYSVIRDLDILESGKGDSESHAG
jgi:anti-sigma factor RsiW